MTETSWAAMLPQLSFGDTLLAIAGLAFSTHMMFKNFEPSSAFTHFGLILATPALATVLMAQHLAILQAIASTFALFYGILLSSIILYRISPIHPLARYPGPLHLKISKFSMALVANTGKERLYVAKLHEQYGGAVRTGPNEVSFSDVVTIDPLMGSNGLPKGPMWEGRSPDSSGSSLIALPDLKEHANRRKIWNRAFTSAALKEYEEFIAKRARDFVEVLSSSHVVDLNLMVGRFTFDFMSEMAFGGGSELIREGDKENKLDVLEQGLITSWQLGHIPWIGKYAYKIPGAGDDVRLMRNFARGLAAIRIKSGSTRRDLFHYLAGEDITDGPRPPVRQAVSDGGLAVIAGVDTIASALSMLFFSLLRQPETYKRLQQEVDKYYPPETNALDTKYHPKMSYLTAVINEALRMYPSVPTGSQRMNRDKVGKAIGPYYLPPGTAAAVHFWTIQRDERNFSPAPNSFWPDRWLIAAGETKYEGPANQRFIHNVDAFLPFSFGPASCAGKNLAMQEMRMLVCHMMQKLELKFAEGFDPDSFENGLRDYLLLVREKMPVTVTLREKA